MTTSFPTNSFPGLYDGESIILIECAVIMADVEGEIDVAVQIDDPIEVGVEVE